ncbi:MAG: DUF551 domain-containing protein [Lachnospiraceae bacterium]|nr:DUF551 domain-containing protein [Lachnospiraceae bacterium]
MNVLEKILEEIEETERRYDEHTNMFALGGCSMAAEIKEIIRSHMNDVIISEMENIQNDDWIPCSERLPNQNGVYNVTRLIDDAFISDSAYFDGQDTWHNDNRVNHARSYLTDIVAWQPLPEPYKPKKATAAGMEHIVSRFTKVE